MNTILFNDDNKSGRDAIGVMLKRENFTPILAGGAQISLESALALQPHLLLVDLHSPDMDERELHLQPHTPRIRIPIIVLGAFGDQTRKIPELEAEAVGTGWLLTRIRALLQSTSLDTEVLAFADVEVDISRRVVWKRGEEVKLTRTEYNLLAHFLTNPGRILTRDMLLNSVWGYQSFTHTRTVDAHVARLRQKLEPARGGTRHFRTVHGVGYRFMPQ